MSYKYLGTITYGISNAQGVPQPGVAITVYKYGTATLATLYATPSAVPYTQAGATQVGNPTNTDANGNLELWAAPGTYTLFQGATQIKSIQIPADPADNLTVSTAPSVGQVPTWSGTDWVPQTPPGAGSMSNPMTTTGDLITAGAGGTPVRLGPVGAAGTVLTSAGSGLSPYWGTVSSGGGGFTNPMTSVGDLIQGGTSGAATRLAAGTKGFVPASQGAGQPLVYIRSGCQLLNAVTQYGAVADNTTDSATAINNALSDAYTGGGGVVEVPTAAHSYNLKSPLVIPPGVELRGDRPYSHAIADIAPTGVPGQFTSTAIPYGYGTTFRIDAAFANTAYGAYINAGIILIEANKAGYSVPSNGQHLKWFLVDGTNAPSAVSGVGVYGGVAAWALSEIALYNITGSGVLSVVGTGKPDGHTMEHVVVNFCQGSGFDGYFKDGFAEDCHAQSCGVHGFNLTGASNSRWVGCRGDLSTNGFQVDVPHAGGGYNDANTFVGCGTQRNLHYGFSAINSDGTYRSPIQIIGGMFDADGVNTYSTSTDTGTGGGGYSGINVQGPNTVFISGGTVVLVGSQDVNAGCPDVGLRMATQNGSPQIVQMLGGLLNGVTSGRVGDTVPTHFSLSQVYIATGAITANTQTYTLVNVNG